LPNLLRGLTQRDGSTEIRVKEMSQTRTEFDSVVAVVICGAYSICGMVVVVKNCGREGHSTNTSLHLGL